MLRNASIIIAGIIFLASPTGLAQQDKASKGSQKPPVSSSQDGAIAASPDKPTRNTPDISIQVDSPEKKSETQNSGWSAFWGWISGWQFIVLIIVGYLFFAKRAPYRVEDLLSPFQSLKVLGNEFVLGKSGGVDAESRILLFRKRVQRKFDRWALSKGISEKHKKVIESHVKPLLPNFNDLKIRSTIHVPDLLFSEALYQLIDYYPGPTGKRGRAFSTRFGIIGKAWRHEASQYDPFVPGQQKLILEYGMTRDEARRTGQEKQSFACVILTDQHREKTDERETFCKALATFYMDSSEKNAFGQDKNSESWARLCHAIHKGAQETGLTAALDELHRDLIETSARIQIFRR